MVATFALAFEPDSLEERVPAPGPRELLSRERVLLLEDDSTFREIIRDYLTECGFTVVTANNGVEGVQEVIASDFSVILCDMMMPKLPGDMFYRAVERTRPKLCGRFIFMTGHRGNEATNAFIDSVNGKVLMKPFPMDALLDIVALIQIRDQFLEEALEIERVAAISAAHEREIQTQDTALRVFEVAAERRDRVETPASPPRPAEVVEPTALPGLSTNSSVRRPALLASTVTEPSREGKRSSAGALAGLALAAIFAGSLGAWDMALQKLVAANAVDREVLEAEWTTVSGQMDEAKKAKPEIETVLDLPKRLVAERDAPRWMAALRSVATSASPELELRVISAQGVPAVPGTCELRIEGFAIGRSPRLIADRFRRALQFEMERQSGGSATVGFEKLEDDTQSAPVTEQKRAAFIITANYSGVPE